MPAASAPSPGLQTGGICLRLPNSGALAQASSDLLSWLDALGMKQDVELQDAGDGNPGAARFFRLRTGLSERWAPGFDTLGLSAQLQLDTEQRQEDLEREVLLAMLLGPLAFEFPSFAELAASVRMRCYAVQAARKTALAFYTNEADRPEDCWSYDEDRGFTVRPGHGLIAALIKATQPGATGRRYAFSCYRATEYVMLLAIAQELETSNPALLADLQRQWEHRAIRSDEFRSVFLHEHGSEQAPLPPGYYVPGDRVWFRNPDPHSSDATGYEGSWVLYLGGGRFTNFWTADPPYTLHSKCVEMFQWRHAAYTDAAGEVRIDESVVEQRLQALAADPAQTAQILRQMLRLRSPPGAADPGGCLDASRESPRHVCLGSAGLALPSGLPTPA
ncbi:MAG: putative lipoprotein [Polaromonas sp.]|nr:putative lipoprotein [Polaromonas sp.]